MASIGTSTDHAGMQRPPERYRLFDAATWRGLRDGLPLSIAEEELAELRGINEPTSLEEIADVYLPLSRLINLHYGGLGQARDSVAAFTGRSPRQAPYIVGLAGSVAVGKSTTARILRSMLAKWPEHGRVDLISTDGFLYPLAELERRDIMHRKGFPESFDREALVRFLARVRNGEPDVPAPIYSHVAYDIVAGDCQIVDRPDILIIEGLNVLQINTEGHHAADTYVSDFFDFSIFLDADVTDIRHWYVERFLTLRETVFRDPKSYFHRYAKLDDEEARAVAGDIWERINAVNLREHILSTRYRADVVLYKTRDHRIASVAVDMH